jgi:hypothetical protein
LPMQIPRKTRGSLGVIIRIVVYWTPSRVALPMRLAFVEHITCKSEGFRYTAALSRN